MQVQSPFHLTGLWFEKIGNTPKTPFGRTTVKHVKIKEAIFFAESQKLSKLALYLHRKYIMSS